MLWYGGFVVSLGSFLRLVRSPFLTVVSSTVGSFISIFLVG